MNAKKRKGSVLFKLALAVFAVYIVATFISLQMQINSKKAQLTEINQKIENKTSEKEELSNILNAEVDKEYVERIARGLGYVNPDERVYESVTGD